MIPVQSMTARAQNIHKCLEEGFHICQARQEAESLYQEGVKLVIGEVERNPLLSTEETASSVVAVLNRITGLDTIQHHSLFHQSLSKAYRVFIELTWYQCLREGNRPVFLETRDQIIAHSSKIKKALPNEIVTRFEYSCARQGAKLLTPTEAIWQKHVDSILYLGLAIEAFSIVGAAAVLKQEIENVGKDWLKSWYPDVHYLRWMSVSTNSTQDFINSIGSAELVRLQQEGGKYTVCLAIAFMGFINRSDVDPSSKTLAARYVDDLLCLKSTHWIKKFVDWALQQKPISVRRQEYVKKWDPYWKTRAVIRELLPQVNKEYSEYIHPNVQLFITQHSYSIHEGEKKEIQSSLSKLQKKYQDSAKFIEEVNDYLASVGKGDNRAGEDEEVQQAKQDLEEAEKDAENIQAEMTVLESLAEILQQLKEEEELAFQQALPQ